jgi:hypothetical protein
MRQACHSAVRMALSRIEGVAAAFSVALIGMGDLLKSWRSCKSCLVVFLLCVLCASSDPELAEGERV